MGKRYRLIIFENQMDKNITINGNDIDNYILI